MAIPHVAAIRSNNSAVLARFPPFFQQLAIVIAATAPFAAAHAEDADIAHIEHNLRPPVAIEGRPVPANTLAESMRRLHVPGVSVAVIRDGKVAWARGYGVAYAGGPAVTPDTLFQAASISKPVTALAALRMAETGELSLDADINAAMTNWKLPPGPSGATASLRQLLSHTAGTTAHGFAGYAHGAAVPTLLQVLDGVKPANSEPVRIDIAPGSIERYSGGGYLLVQQALVDRSGKPFAELLASSVLTPLGMDNSTFVQPLPTALAARAAQPHDAKGAPYAGGAYTYPEQAAAGLWTTPSDLARFAIGVQRSVAGQGILSPEMARTMLQPVKGEHGLGPEVEGEGASRAFGHGGVNTGFQNSLYAFTEHGDGAVVMTNGDNGFELARGLMRAIAAEYGWPANQTVMRTAQALPAAQRKALEGRYRIVGAGDFEIRQQKGQLMFSAHGAAFEPLYAASPTVLFVLSRELELHLTRAGRPRGRLVSGAFDQPYKRVK
ncbi:serine hydrolase domain-containing protein [Rugamonas sp. CCM 8940]|uniref:serine hydrolase domain-containing protein n=1 Tax=Rugamonas sp. CCM 8940 TaxID=2765359 RepID=UPI0018F6065F|nr:serine hydrolase domain-containing protein [Rugamonas sp. CCM 8940]MBJ7313175.1 beta-lactamase family protein [Rugamonas sp. CCM 8940]